MNDAVAFSHMPAPIVVEATRLKLHVPTVFGALELDAHQVRVLVDAEEIDPPAGIGPIAELFGDYEHVLRDDVGQLPTMQHAERYRADVPLRRAVR